MHLDALSMFIGAAIVAPLADYICRFIFRHFFPENAETE